MCPVPIGEPERIETPAGGTMMSAAVWGTPGATPVVMLHGIPTNALLWRRIGPTLSAEGFRAFAPDLLGYGRSGDPTKGSFGVADQARYLHQFLSALGLRDVILVGHDIGGGVAMTLAAAHPELVVGLVLIDTVVEANWPTLPIKLLGVPPLTYLGGAIDLAFGFKRFITRSLRSAMRHPGRLTPPTIEAYSASFESRGGTAQVARLARDLTSKDTRGLTAKLATAGIPLLVLWGEHDTLLQQADGAALASAVPDSEFLIIKDSGHLVPEENPFALAETMLPYLRGRVTVRSERTTGRQNRTGELRRGERTDG